MTKNNLLVFGQKKYMAKNRMVSTSFWSDNYSSNLDPIEKLLFLYLMTNERSTLAGVYELPLKIMAVETGIEIEMLKKIMQRFEAENKIRFQDGWVAIKNYLKYHEHGSPTVKKGIEDAIKVAPEWAREFVGKGIDTLTPFTSTLTSSSVGEVPPRRFVNGDEEEKPPRKVKTTPSMKQVFNLFENPDKATWHMREIERVAAQTLFDTFGLDKIERYLQAVKKEEGSTYISNAHSPSLLLKNLPSIKRYFTQ